VNPRRELNALTDARRQLGNAQRIASDAVELLTQVLGKSGHETLRVMIARTELGNALTALDERIEQLRGEAR